MVRPSSTQMETQSHVGMPKMWPGWSASEIYVYVHDKECSFFRGRV